MTLKDLATRVFKNETESVDSIVSDVVVFQVVLLKFGVLVPSHLDGVENFLSLVDPVVRQAYFFQRSSTRKALKQQNGPFVAEFVP